MSQALDLIRQDFANVSKVIEVYNTHLKPYKADLQIKGKSIERANVEQASLLSYYDERRVELRAIMQYLEMNLERVYGTKWKQYTENYNRELTPKDKEQYIKHDPAYVVQREIYIEMEELYKQFESAVESFKARGYALNNITKIKVAQISDVIL
jgi:hypothetical protein